ncbi:MAG TPA: signal peptidase II [Vicinamibacterales bacterium]|nr:signal peptidase II [Vicinamibacterales bacterium]
MITLRRGVLLCLLLAGTAGCDRVTKHLAVTTLAGAPNQSFFGDTVRLQYHENPGAFLAFGASWSPSARAFFFQFGNALFLAAAGFLASRYRWSRVASYGLVLFLAGGLSNLADRLAIGSVIDFLNVGIGPIRTGIFNVADVAIMAGIAMVLWEVLRNSYTPTVRTSANDTCRQ